VEFVAGILVKKIDVDVPTHCHTHHFGVMGEPLVAFVAFFVDPHVDSAHAMVNIFTRLAVRPNK